PASSAAPSRRKCKLPHRQSGGHSLPCGRACRSNSVGVRLAYDSPAPIPKDQGREEVGEASEPAPLAKETRLRNTVGLLAVPASRARPRGVAGVHEDHPNAGHPRFVLHKGAELSERPGRQRGPLGLPSPNPRADALEVFEG